MPKKTEELAGVEERKVRTRTVYTPDEKRAVVKEALQVGNASRVAREKGIAENLLYRWMKAYQEDVVNGQPADTVDGIKGQISELQSRINELKMRLGEMVLEQE